MMHVDFIPFVDVDTIPTKRGTRPSAPCDQRTASTYSFGAVRVAQLRSGDPDFGTSKLKQ
jgi:hypothetical protein